MNLEEIEELIKLLKDTDITEIDLKEDKNYIKIKRAYHNLSEGSYEDQFIYKKIKSETEKKLESSNENKEEIVAPMVGTFYRAPAPDAEPFIKIGDNVKAGDTLCIIEAMKLMNEIEAEKGGIITDIIVENGKAVEYGQPLFIIER